MRALIFFFYVSPHPPSVCLALTLQGPFVAAAAASFELLALSLAYPPKRHKGKVKQVPKKTRIHSQNPFQFFVLNNLFLLFFNERERLMSVSLFKSVGAWTIKGCIRNIKGDETLRTS